ncbi:MAG: glucose-1-phosphate adenylyltransferase subunit GlgD [Bacilli bacterium]|jgi:glucose-1-phosphate adenylyltransferase|nr:glucose-1-phosphate adenylyltransferase subunit GlgD [Bacilli bacterium]MDD3388757.1 glucose-1-phosphate adenylyltransferase subunit GlgD [Bacilli bacterium]MDD4344547.1 glucose-1-phosphate adenylyltransferase subunit GlgD [Bacilli bacterium]MDD4520441.1 glucose-1-phosphate adenylyltransferase subunit GlgD [Bacilli bacterium]MDY0399144.1 glucose-1-phosphate adenylyltransferase subunit GlgD [Bacilli bacterium]
MDYQKVIGFLNLHHSPSLGPLTADRPLASTSFLGRYAFMDFTLSNFTNSRIDEVGILIQTKPRSILKHLGSNNTWNTNTKTGFEIIMYNEEAIGNKRYNNDFANIRANDWVLKRSDADYVIVAPAHFIMAIDYREVLAQHIASHAQITLVYTPATNARNHFIGSDVLTLNEEKLVSEIRPNKGTVNKANISLETYVINRAKFIELMEKAATISSFFCLHDIVSYTCGTTERVNTYAYHGYVRCFDSLEHYVEYSMELLDYSNRAKLFRADWPIYTVTHDTPPTRYLPEANVRNSFIANGAHIQGNVRNSIISRGVVVGANSKVSNAIILSSTVIGENIEIDHVIIDKYCKIRHAKSLKGEKGKPLYIKQGDQI